MEGLDIVTALHIAGCEAAAEFWRAVGGFAAIALCLALASLPARYLWTRICAWTSWCKRHGIQACIVAFFACGVAHYGMTKQTTGRVTYPYTDVETRYLYDAGSYVTNDYVHVAFTKSAVVPDSADFLGYVRPCGSTNDEDWVQILATTFAKFHSPSNVPFAGAISNDFQFFTTFTPGPVVHTNGVAVINWQKPFDGSTNRFATIRTGIYVEGRRLAPNPAITNGPPVIYFNLNGANENE